MNGKKHTHFRSVPTASDGVEFGNGERVAPLRYRLMAILYDALIVLAIWVFTIVTLVTVIGDAVIGAWVQTLLFIEMYAFFAFFWCLKGQTLGMLAWRLSIRCDGRFTPTQAIGRFVGGMASFATFGLGFFWMWFDRDGMTWSDRLSRSIVVRSAD
ncbi:MAG: RDD family protein [Gammaproteobacteria bacterium]|nr:RDD family protein [Gammaproteobacteria bacterium]